MSHQEPCACTKEEDCPHFAWPACVGRERGDLTWDYCRKCNPHMQAQTWHLDGKCIACREAPPKGHNHG